MDNKIENKTVEVPTSTPVPAVETKADEKRDAEIAAFLDEFAYSDAHATQLRKAIEDKTMLDGSKYFQSRLKKVQGA